MEQIVLRPNCNRKKLSSIEGIKIEKGLCHNDSLEKSPSDKVLLIVPPYTKIDRPLDCIEENLRRKNSNYQLEKDLELISNLRKNNICSLSEMKRAGIPMGLLRVGTAAKKAGYNVSIIDAVFEGWNNDRVSFETLDGTKIISYGLTKSELEEKIRDSNPGIVGITIDYTHQWGNAREVADLVKKINPNAVVIMGGSHAHALPKDVLLDSPTDYVVFGPSDNSFVDLLNSLTKKRDRIENIEGIGFRKNGKVVRNKPRKSSLNIEEIAIPDLSLINLELYNQRFHSAGERKTNNGYLVYGFTSIGCNTGCNFCTIPAIQGQWRSIKEKSLENYLQYISLIGVREFIVEDDHLFHDPSWALTVFEKLNEYNLSWIEEGGVSLFNLTALLPEVSENYITKNAGGRQYVFRNTLIAKRKGLTSEELIEKMSKSGCHSVYLAVESANDDALDYSNKPRINTQEKYTKRIIGLFNKFGIKTTCGIMLGFMNQLGENDIYIESRENIERTIEYGKKLMSYGASFVNPFILTPLPGAPHFDSLKKYTLKDTDLGYSHEFGTLTAPNGEWTPDELNLMRVRLITETIGFERYKRMIETETWPV